MTCIYVHDRKCRLNEQWATEFARRKIFLFLCFNKMDNQVVLEDHTFCLLFCVSLSFHVPFYVHPEEKKTFLFLRCFNFLLFLHFVSFFMLWYMYGQSNPQYSNAFTTLYIENIK